MSLSIPLNCSSSACTCLATPLAVTENEVQVEESSPADSCSIWQNITSETTFQHVGEACSEVDVLSVSQLCQDQVENTTSLVCNNGCPPNSTLAQDGSYQYCTCDEEGQVGEPIQSSSGFYTTNASTSYYGDYFRPTFVGSVYFEITSGIWNSSEEISSTQWNSEDCSLQQGLDDCLQLCDSTSWLSLIHI